MFLQWPFYLWFVTERCFNGVDCFFTGYFPNHEPNRFDVRRGI